MSATLVDQMADTAWSVALAVAPLGALFLIFQLFLLKLPRRQITDIVVGTLIATIGLFVFLLGVGIGFLPFGRAIGATLAALQQPWLFVLGGVLLGYFTTWGEPSVRVLADQVEGASQGSIDKSLVLYAICTGVALMVGLGVLRISYDIPLLYLLGPGYLLAIGLMWLSDQDFVGIAVDASGVATGPLANTFLLAFALGASAAMGGREPMVNGLGMVALIALAPIIPVMLLGVLVRLRDRAKE